MIDIQSAVPFIVAVEKATGTRPHCQTVRRWITKGVRGVRLEAVVMNGGYYTSPEAVREFIHATTQARLDAASREPVKAEVAKPVVPGRVKAAVEQFSKLPKSARKMQTSAK